MIHALRLELEAQRKVIFYVRAVPNAPKTKVLKIMEDESVKIAIAAPAEKGRANMELIRFLSEEFSVPKANVKIASGASARIKLIEVSR